MYIYPHKFISNRNREEEKRKEEICVSKLSWDSFCDMTRNEQMQLRCYCYGILLIWMRAEEVRGIGSLCIYKRLSKVFNRRWINSQRLDPKQRLYTQLSFDKPIKLVEELSWCKRKNPVLQKHTYTCRQIDKRTQRHTHLHRSSQARSQVHQDTDGYEHDFNYEWVREATRSITSVE